MDYTGLPVASRVELAETPFFPQQAYQCGPAALATVLVGAGAGVSPQQLQPQLFIPERKGSLQAEMLVTPARYGLLGVRSAAAMPDLFELVEAGHPVVVLQNLGAGALPIWHYAVVFGYDLQKRELYLRSGTEPRAVFGFRRFERTWARAGNWAMVVVAPDDPPPAVTPENYLQAASTLERLGRHRQALLAYRRATGRWPDNPLAWAGSGNAAYALADYAAAESAYREALRHAPANVFVLNNLAMALARRGCAEQARSAIDCALGHSPGVSELQRTAAEIGRYAPRGKACRPFSCPFPAP